MTVFVNLFGVGDDERELLAIYEREERDLERDLEIAARHRALERADVIFDDGVGRAGAACHAPSGCSGAPQAAAPVSSASPDAVRLARDPREERTLGWMRTR
jgi:hypothetical protein